MERPPTGGMAILGFFLGWHADRFPVPLPLLCLGQFIRKLLRHGRAALLQLLSCRAACDGSLWTAIRVPRHEVGLTPAQTPTLSNQGTLSDFVQKTLIIGTVELRRTLYSKNSVLLEELRRTLCSVKPENSTRPAGQC
jgi:hypothetical protein